MVAEFGVGLAARALAQQRVTRKDGPREHAGSGARIGVLLQRSIPARRMSLCQPRRI